MPAVIQSKNGDDADPVPTGDFLALFPQRFGLSPLLSLPGVPGIDFDDQGERLGWRSLAGRRRALQLFPGIELGQARSASGFGPQALKGAESFFKFHVVRERQSTRGLTCRTVSMLWFRSDENDKFAFDTSIGQRCGQISRAAAEIFLEFLRQFPSQHDMPVWHYFLEFPQ